MLSLHLAPAGLAESLGITPAAARQALASPPAPGIDAYLRMWAALQTVQTRVQVAAAPVRFRVDLARADALFGDGEFRRSRGLLELPANLGELRRLVGKLRRRRSLLRTVRRLEGSFIPTATGLGSWRKTTVSQTLRHGQLEDPTPLGVTDEMRERWRRYVLAVITSGACPPDAAAIARYHYRSDRAGLEVRYTSTRPMPACVAEWTRAGLEAMRHLGVEVLDEPDGRFQNQRRECAGGPPSDPAGVVPA